MKVIILMALFLSLPTFGQTTILTLEREFNEITEGLNPYGEPPTYSVAKTKYDQIKKFHEKIQRLHTSQSAALENSTEKYKEMFSLFARINPLNNEADECYDKDVKPKERIVSRLSSLMYRSGQISKTLEKAASPIEFGDYMGYICGVYNPSTDKVEWKKGTATQHAGVYNPFTGSVEWKEVLFGRLEGVYNPQLKKVEWKETISNAIGGVYNPVTKQVEWKESLGGGVAGVFNPNKGIVEWETRLGSSIAGVYNPQKKAVEWKEKFQSGVAGAYDPVSKSVIWHEKYLGTVSVVFKPPMETPLASTCGSNYPPEAYEEE